MLRLTITIVFAISMVFTAPAWCRKPVLENKHMVVYKIKGSLKELVTQAKNAITEHGIVINNIIHVANMLNRTGKDLGAGKQIYLDSQSLVFCSAKISRETMEATPLNIMMCPYVIHIYVLAKEPDYVYLGYRRPAFIGDPASVKSLKAVDKLLRDITLGAIEW